MSIAFDRDPKHENKQTNFVSLLSERSDERSLDYGS